MDERELFIVGAKARLRDMSERYDKGDLPQTEYALKVEAMAQVGENDWRGRNIVWKVEAMAQVRLCFPG